MRLLGDIRYAQYKYATLYAGIDLIASGVMLAALQRLQVLRDALVSQEER